jgi:DNA-binding XRE family transcriptional regulator
MIDRPLSEHAVEAVSCVGGRPVVGESNGNGCKRKPPRLAQARSVDELIGRKIQLRRTALAIAMEDLAQAVGVTPTELEAFEQGSVRVDARLLAEIAKMLSVSVAWFFIRSED